MNAQVNKDIIQPRKQSQKQYPDFDDQINSFVNDNSNVQHSMYPDEEPANQKAFKCDCGQSLESKEHL